MTCTHLTINELVLIESYYHTNKGIFVVKLLKRSKQTIYNVYQSFADGLSALDYYKRYKNNKKKCGRGTNSLTRDTIKKHFLLNSSKMNLTGGAF